MKFPHPLSVFAESSSAVNIICDVGHCASKLEALPEPNMYAAWIARSMVTFGRRNAHIYVRCTVVDRSIFFCTTAGEDEKILCLLVFYKKIPSIL